MTLVHQAARTIAMPGGQLKIDVIDAAEPLERLCGFGARAGNPRRPFLVVSRVLGKHVPVAPHRMASIHDALARRLPDGLIGPVLFVGLAETATGLGRGTYDRWCRLTGRTDAAFVASTRHPLRGPNILTFLEPHSHAVQHWCEIPGASPAGAAFGTAVLVDDEVTTGTTLANLETALRAHLPSLREVLNVTIIDWGGEEASATISLLRGRLTFDTVPIEAPTTLPADPSAHVAPSGAAPPIPDRIRALAERRRIPAGARVLVLGMGEYLHMPYLFATALEDLGAAVVFQSTTRSPAAVWGEIQSAIAFSDPGERGAERFLYNAAGVPYDHVLLCLPDPCWCVPEPLQTVLRAEPVLLT